MTEEFNPTPKEYSKYIATLKAEQGERTAYQHNNDYIIFQH